MACSQKYGKDPFGGILFAANDSLNYTRAQNRANIERIIHLICVQVKLSNWNGRAYAMSKISKWFLQ